jgi:ubiquinone/menaquinone biosynthesis C-methylase UbiE
VSGTAAPARKASETMSKSLVQRQFGANAANYAASPVHAAGASLARLVELVKPQKHWRALDIATGAGHTAAAFAPHVASIVACDVTEEMLAEVQKLAAAKSLANIEITAADAEHLPFAGASFDLVTCRIAPHHFADVPAFLAESWRVLKSGGIFALVDNIAPDATTTPGFSEAELRTAAVRFNALEKVRDPSHARALTAGEWRELVAQTGLRIEHEELLPKPMGFEAWCRNTSVPAATVPKLEAMLRDAGPCLRAFLQPRPAGGGIEFILRELVLIGCKQ